jgi:hypothetical protein
MRVDGQTVHTVTTPDSRQSVNILRRRRRVSRQPIHLGPTRLCRLHVGIFNTSPS